MTQKVQLFPYLIDFDGTKYTVDVPLPRGFDFHVVSTQMAYSRKCTQISGGYRFRVAGKGERRRKCGDEHYRSDFDGSWRNQGSGEWRQLIGFVCRSFPAFARRWRPEIELSPIALSSVALPTISGAPARMPGQLASLDHDRARIAAQGVQAIRRRHQ
jgi:hypothetical protein